MLTDPVVMISIQDLYYQHIMIEDSGPSSPNMGLLMQSASNYYIHALASSVAWDGSL